MSEKSAKYNVGVGIPNQHNTLCPPVTTSLTGELKTAYIPTVFITPPELKVGEVWYVKFSGSNCLSEEKIVDVTDKTVLLEKFDANYFVRPTRFKKTDIEFVEKVKY